MTSAAERVSGSIAAADAAGWELLAGEPNPQDPLEKVDAARTRAAAALHTVEAARTFDDRGVRPAYAAYWNAVDRELGLFDQGGLHEARIVKRTSVDTASELLETRLDRAIAAQDRSADRAGTRAERATWIAIILGAAALALLIAQLIQQRRLVARERYHTEQLRALDRLKDEFVASVSHELRTPLTSIRGYLELVLEVRRDRSRTASATSWESSTATPSG